ncbi:MAG: hypothetical protein EKK36_01980 [Bradyrhizobiaceae bacterium]|nr:MAG: hypothetical protein EKK36_01980 [Bradyrhizobiaceae bacterium]
MNDSSQEPITGHIRSRPIRVAFFVEDGENIHLKLDAIFAASMAIWGGRYSLIVPCDNGYPRERYLSWLKAFDPDVIYSYIDLSDENLLRVREMFGPAYLVRHLENIKGEATARDFRVELPIRPLSSLSTTLQYSRAFPASAPQPATVVDYNPGQPHDRFIDDNFGSCYGSFGFWPLPKNLADAVVTVSVMSQELLDTRRGQRPEGVIVNDATALLHYMATHKNSFGLAQIAADAAPRIEVRDNFNNAFTLVIGDSFADRVVYWNRRAREPVFLGREPSTLIVSPARLTDDSFFAALVEFLKKRNGVPYNSGTPRVRLCSASLSTEDLEIFRERLRAADKWNGYHVLEPVTLDSIAPEDRVLEHAHHLVTGDFFQRSPEWKEFPADGASVRPPPITPEHIVHVQTSNYATSGAWALDVSLERQENHSRYSNVRHIWYFPRRLRFHEAFCSFYESRHQGVEFRHTRATRHGSLSLFAGFGEELPSIKLVTDEKAFRFAMQRGNSFPPFRRHDAWKQPAGPFSWVQPSDKGRYLLGALRMFGGLQQAGAVLLHMFWRSAFEELGGAIGTARRELIAATIKKRLRTVDTPPNAWKEDTWERVAAIVASEAHQVRLPQQSFSFESFIARHQPYVDFEEEEVKKSHIQDPAEQADWMQSIKRSLRKGLQDRCAEKVLFQGHRWRCKTCFNTNWNDLESLSSELTCTICGGKEPMPVDKPWFFRLNGFLGDAMREHGLIPLVWCLMELEARARDTFSFLGPHELWIEYSKDDSALCDHEADLICLVDGLVHLCEVKSSVRDINLESLIEVAKRLRPDVVMLAVMEEDSARLRAKFDELRAALDGTEITAKLISYVEDERQKDARLP